MTREELRASVMTNFAYLLNAMERAAGEHNPAEHDYCAKRTAVLAHVADLEAERDQLREERDRLKAALSKSKQTAERWRADCMYFWSMS